MFRIDFEMFNYDPNIYLWINYVLINKKYNLNHRITTSIVNGFTNYSREIYDKYVF